MDDFGSGCRHCGISVVILGCLDSLHEGITVVRIRKRTYTSPIATPTVAVSLASRRT